MDPAIKLPSRKRSTDTSTDWNLCFLCQKNTKKTTTRTLAEQGLHKILQTIDVRKKFNDDEHLETLERCQAANLSELCQKGLILYHKDCYAIFTSSLHLNRLRKKGESGSKSSQKTDASLSTQHEPRAALRSDVKKVNFDLCIFCQTEKREKTNLVATMEVSDKVLRAAGSDYTMRCRLAVVSDLVAADAKYHLKCYVVFMRKHTSDGTSLEDKVVCIERVAEELKCGMNSGAMYTLLNVWERYS